MMELREIFVGSRHEWKGQAVRDLDISRQSFIVMVRRGGEMIVPRGSLVLQENDSVFMYTKKKRNEAVQEKA
jgi:voltage-gated potassium channel